MPRYHHKLTSPLKKRGRMGGVLYTKPLDDAGAGDEAPCTAVNRRIVTSNAPGAQPNPVGVQLSFLDAALECALGYQLDLCSRSSS